MNNTYSAVGALNVLLRNSTTARPLSHQVITGSSTAIGRLTVPAGAKYALLVFEAADLSVWGDSTKIARYWFDSGATTVTTSVGIPAPNYTVIELSNPTQMEKFSFILTEVQAAVVNVQYFK